LNFLRIRKVFTMHLQMLFHIMKIDIEEEEEEEEEAQSLKIALLQAIGMKC